MESPYLAVVTQLLSIDFAKKSASEMLFRFNIATQHSITEYYTLFFIECQEKNEKKRIFFSFGKNIPNIVPYVSVSNNASIASW